MRTSSPAVSLVALALAAAPASAETAPRSVGADPPRIEAVYPSGHGVSP